jgi:hypothetical protein
MNLLVEEFQNIGIPGYENPFGEEAIQARQDAQDEAAEDLAIHDRKARRRRFCRL